MSSGPVNPGSNLELRIAAIEDRLSKMNVSQADTQTFQKSASHASGPSSSLIPQVCQLCYHCVISVPVSVPVHTHVLADQTQTQHSGAGFDKLGK